MHSNHCSGLLALAAFCGFAVPSVAQTFVAMPLVTGLSSPTGITIDELTGDLFFSEVPAPGVSGAANGNRVARRDVGTGVITTLVAGEPEPVNLACQNGTLYWTCKSVGVVFRYQGGVSSLFRSGLSSPSGIAADATNTLFLTQLPTPGMPGTMGGTNTVDMIVGGGAITNVSAGEPEPMDVTVTPAGLVYWTCRSAGVILRYDPAATSVTMALNGLQQPTGLASDDAGNLYFTEVPTPGVSGAMGGSNRVWKYDPATSNLTLISSGEPEPVDIAVTGDGATVYWTCRTAGVIFRAMATGNRPIITTTSTTAPGDTVTFNVSAPGEGGRIVLVGNSLGLGPIAVPGLGTLALEDDQLMGATFGAANNATALGYFGMLDANGNGSAQFVIPAAPALSGVVFFTGAAMFDLGSLTNLSSTLRTVIQ